MASTQSTRSYTKHFVPLESDPELFTELIHSLGAYQSLSFQEVYSTDDPEMLSFVPRPIHALLMVLPTTPAYEKRVAVEDGNRSIYEATGNTIWLSQTINNACGLYAILHAIANSEAKGLLEPASTLSQILSVLQGKSVEEAAKYLEESEELKKAYHAVALQGSTSPPPNAEDEVDYHYLCFARGDDGASLYELDGDRKGPIKRCSLPPESDMLSEQVLNVIRSYLQAEEGGSLRFSLMALCNLAK